jgi:hypothetical protein
MYERSRLGIVPVVAVALVQEAPKIMSDIESLFTGSSYDATHQAILGWCQAIVQDPHLTNLTTQNDWLRLRCWAGDQSVITPANTAYLFGSGSVAQGCGCEVAHGCRADAQQAVATLKKNVPALTTGYLSTAPVQNPGASTTPGGTIYTPLPGGGGLNLPVPVSSLLNATVGGIPVMVIGLGLAVLAFAGGRRGRH